MFSRPNSGLKFTNEGALRKFMVGESDVDVHSHCLLTDEVSSSYSETHPLNVLVLKELRYYNSQFKQGIQGPLSYYRTSKARYEEEKGNHTVSNVHFVSISDIPQLPTFLLVYVPTSRFSSCGGPLIQHAHNT
jgi:soluble epoxide hydrolase/lipid-phosphate phosphatase